MTAVRRGRFRSLGSKQLVRLGLEGDEVFVRLEGDQLVLTGSTSGRLVIPAAAVDRLRHFGTEQVQALPANIPPMLEVKIWWGGRREPLFLTPYAQHKAYGAVIGGFAERIVAWRGIDRLWIGPGYTTGIVNLLIVAPPCLMLFGLLVGLSLWQSAWWWLATVPLTALFVWLGGRNIISRWPRRVASIAAFKAHLPGPPS